jgi:hypothetical protein
MTIAELIQELLKFNQDAEIYVNQDEGTSLHPLGNNPFTETELFISKNEKVPVVIIEV